jgi:hypothetical protein
MKDGGAGLSNEVLQNPDKMNQLPLRRKIDCERRDTRRAALFEQEVRGLARDKGLVAAAPEFTGELQHVKFPAAVNLCGIREKDMSGIDRQKPYRRG